MSTGSESTNERSGSESDGPIGAGNYVVQAGECLSSIACAHGFFYETLWNLPENIELKQKRKSPHVLMAGDKVHIPELRSKEAEVPAETRQKFKRKGVPSRLKLQLRDYEGKPRAGASYKLDIDGNVSTGKLDGSGILDVVIPPSAREAKLNIEDGEEEFTIALGGTDPVSELSGVQQRLNNLGYVCGSPDGIPGARTTAAVSKFQRDQGLAVNGKPDQPTRERLV